MSKEKENEGEKEKEKVNLSRGLSEKFIFYLHISSEKSSTNRQKCKKVEKHGEREAKRERKSNFIWKVSRFDFEILFQILGLLYLVVKVYNRFKFSILINFKIHITHKKWQIY